MKSILALFVLFLSISALVQQRVSILSGCAFKTNPRVGSSTAVDKLIKNRKSGLSLKTVPGGTYIMGSPGNEGGRNDDECQHSVTVGTFKIGYYEVTQADWYEIMGTQPSYFKNSDDCPVEQVSWDDVQEFIQKLNAMLPADQKPYRLPTEAEWEFAARGGNDSKKYIFSGGNRSTEVSWNKYNSDFMPHPVGGKLANELGLFDMSGNVWEWCQDAYQPYPCDNKTQGRNSVRILRGGSYREDFVLRSAERYGNVPILRQALSGFRLAQD